MCNALCRLWCAAGDKKRLNTIHTCLDILSKSAFEDGVRYGVWKEKLYAPMHPAPSFALQLLLLSVLTHR
jgi:hypothetical protein